MKTRQRNASEDLLSNTRRNKQLKTSEYGSENSLPIPIDLIIEIFSRLPSKSIARSRCLSKLWASILGRPYFTELFLTRSRARPHILFACQKGCELFFFSAPQPRNPDENLSSIVASYHIKFSFDGDFQVSSLVHGSFGVVVQPISTVWYETVPVICNPSTGQSLGSPKVKARSLMIGYDPVNKKFKILYRPGATNRRMNQIRTLETGNMSGRMIECCPLPCYYPPDYICINGVLYYKSWYRGAKVIVCFDLRYENFSCIEVKESFRRAVLGGSTLINYNGKLGLLVTEGPNYLIDGNSTSFKLRVLEDLEKQEWSEHPLYLLPALWKKIVGKSLLKCVGATPTNEIVFSSCCQQDTFYLLYFNIQRNTFLRVDIQGINRSKYHTVHTFLDYVEDVKLM